MPDPAIPTLTALRRAVAHLDTAVELLRQAHVEAPDHDRRIAKLLDHVEAEALVARGLHQVMERGR